MALAGLLSASRNVMLETTNAPRSAFCVVRNANKECRLFGTGERIDRCRYKNDEENVRCDLRLFCFTAFGVFHKDERTSCHLFATNMNERGRPFECCVCGDKKDMIVTTELVQRQTNWRS